jgi:hypothetical protein
MLTYKQNVKAILECIFAGYKDELIENACKRICALTKEQNYMRVYEDGKSDMLEKIRAEIVELPTISINANDVYKAQVLQIIDKYNAESEKKEEISKDDAIKIVHDTIHDFFVDSETFNDKDKLLLKINKAICNNIMGY